jgi:hypothetical protein
VVDDVMDSFPLAGELRGGDEEGHDADRHVDVENQRHHRSSTKNPPSGGPSTVATPNTAPNRPRWPPHWRGETTSPTTAVAPRMSPPPPRPWTVRKTISWSSSWLKHESAEPYEEDHYGGLERRFASVSVDEISHNGVETAEAKR